MSQFSERVESAVRDDHLHEAIHRATSQLRSRRAMAFDSLPDADEVRDRARAIKLELLGSLEDSLLTFEKRLSEQGAHVHWAQDGDEACRLVLEIAKKTGSQRIVKSKSMVTEEIHLNDRLIQGGCEVVETDFGEYIVQIAEDRPSHIILPIIHMTREDVGELFHRELKTPYTDEPEKLTKVARRVLRKRFLEADMGITGANFGIADTGGLCLVSNEGNIRMVTSWPRVQVAILGIEKLVPNLKDLVSFLEVLPRSATGQKLTAYTSILHGPRREDELDGPEELHVILLDNGRTSTLAGEHAEIMACIRCGACLNACPVYKQIGGHAYGDTYPGPMGSILTPTLRGREDWKELPQASSLCGACRDVCPVRIDIPRLLLGLRQESAKKDGLPLQQRLFMKFFAFIATRPILFRMARSGFALGARLVASRGWFKKLPGLGKGWTAHRDLKAPSPKSFTQMWEARRRE